MGVEQAPTPIKAALTIPKAATAGQHIAFTLNATSSTPGVTPASDTESFMVAGKASPSPTPTTSSSSGSHRGGGNPQPSAGASISGNVGGYPGGVGSGGTIPPLPGAAAALPPGFGLGAGSVPSLSGLPRPLSTTNPAVAFPQVTPEPSAVPPPVALPGPERARVANVSAQFPLDARLIGVQVAGLTALAAAVMIAVAQLLLRRRAPGTAKSRPDPGRPASGLSGEVLHAGADEPHLSAQLSRVHRERGEHTEGVVVSPGTHGDAARHS